ncbi:MAG: ABC transporter ATP-binding protein [Peptostreptococcaceae bacterium]
MNIINVDSITTGYEDRIIIDDLSVSIKKGSVTTIIGENGSGKSTLLKTIGRILKPKSGEIKVNDLNIHKTSTKEIAKILGMLPQSPKAPNGLSVAEIVEYGRFPHKKSNGKMTQEDYDIIDWALEKTNLLEFKDRNIQALSGGQRQRVWIAMVLAQETDIILLDEPTTYLDMSYQLEVLQLVKELNEDRGITVVMVLHDINHASRFSKELIMIKKGKVIAQGSPKETMTKEVLREVFEIDATIINLPDTDIPVCLSYELLRAEI